MANQRMIAILCFGVFGLLSTYLGLTGILPKSCKDLIFLFLGLVLSVSVFALVLAFCVPIAPLLYSKFNPKKAYDCGFKRV